VGWEDPPPHRVPPIPPRLPRQASPLQSEVQPLAKLWSSCFCNSATAQAIIATRNLGTMIQGLAHDFQRLTFAISRHQKELTPLNCLKKTSFKSSITRSMDSPPTCSHPPWQVVTIRQCETPLALATGRTST
jgi:hypothetical protein